MPGPVCLSISRTDFQGPAVVGTGASMGKVKGNDDPTSVTHDSRFWVFTHLETDRNPSVAKSWQLRIFLAAPELQNFYLRFPTGL